MLKLKKIIILMTFILASSCANMNQKRFVDSPSKLSYSVLDKALENNENIDQFFNVTNDEFEKVTFYELKPLDSYTRHENGKYTLDYFTKFNKPWFSPYIVREKNKELSLILKIDFRYNEWVFMNKIHFICNGKDLEIELNDVKRKISDTGSIIETSYTNLLEEEINLLKDCRKGKFKITGSNKAFFDETIEKFHTRFMAVVRRYESLKSL